MSLDPQLAAALRAFLRPLILETVRELGIVAAEPTYDAQHLPPGFRSREAFAAECRRLKLNPTFKAGRSWSVPADIWTQARCEDKAHRRGPATAPAADSIDETLQKAGLRLVRGRP